MSRRGTPLDQRGITLPEILIAIAIIGIGLGALLSVVPIATTGIQEGNQTSTATFLAQQRLEEVRGAVWTDSSDCLGLSATAAVAPVPSPAGSCGATAVTFADEASVTGYTQYARTVRITSCGVAPGCGGVTHAALRLVTVRVSYRPITAKGVSSATTTVALEWLVAQRL
jgi:prepilin-type N-terminal cleavage/methylation domain-containing protein